MPKCSLGGMGLFLPKSVKLYGTSSRIQFVFSAESAHAVGVPAMDVVCTAGVPAVAEGAAVAVDVVITCAVGGGVNVGMGSGVGCGLQAERINRINPIYRNFFIRVFLWKYCGVDYILTEKSAAPRILPICHFSCILDKIQRGFARKRDSYSMTNTTRRIICSAEEFTSALVVPSFNAPPPVI